MSGIPFQIVLDRSYDRHAQPKRLAPALKAGATVYLPQVHQVLPRLARLMAALEAELLGLRNDATSYLFLVEGKGLEGMGLHHDGELDSVWLQVEGRRTVTIGPAVPKGTPEDLPPDMARGRGWRRFDLEPGTLFVMPPRTPHHVVCHGRSHAVSMTWGQKTARSPRWDLAPGRPIGAVRSADWVTQVPVGPGGRLPGGQSIRLGVPAAIARQLSSMPRWSGNSDALATLADLGIVARRELPLRIVPADPTALDGWSFR